MERTWARSATLRGVGAGVKVFETDIEACRLMGRLVPGKWYDFNRFLPARRGVRQVG